MGSPSSLNFRLRARSRQRREARSLQGLRHREYRADAQNARTALRMTPSSAQTRLRWRAIVLSTQ